MPKRGIQRLAARLELAFGTPILFRNQKLYLNALFAEHFLVLSRDIANKVRVMQVARDVPDLKAALRKVADALLERPSSSVLK